MRSPPLEDKGAAETACGELTTAPVLHPPASLGGLCRGTGCEAEEGGRRERRGGDGSFF